MNIPAHIIRALSHLEIRQCLYLNFRAKKISSASSNASATSVSEEPRGGFVLRSKSSELGHGGQGGREGRRRSLVERTGMRTFVQVSLLKKPSISNF